MNSRTTFLFKALNTALKPTLRTRSDPARAWEGAVAKAEKVSGIPVSEADAQWIDDYRYLVDRIAELPNLSPVGWQATLAEGSSRLANRLRIRDLHERHPAIAAEPIGKPIFVVGLPRTATTLAHHLLAGSPECRGPLAWEMTHTDLRRDEATTAKRIAQARKQFAVTKWAPDVAVVHPVHVTRPEESLLLLPQGLYHTIIRSPMAEYRDWFLARDPMPDYQYLKAALQVLQHGRPLRRWVLKYPLDLAHIPTILRVFPGATFVWTHRDPVTVMGSVCSLADLMQSLYLTRTDPEEIGRFTLDLMVRVIDAGREHRQEHLSEVVDMPFHKLVADPTHHVPALYRRLGLPWTFEDGERLVTAMARGRTERDRKHEYHLGAYGLTHQEVQRAFDGYQRWASVINN